MFTTNSYNFYFVNYEKLIIAFVSKINQLIKNTLEERMVQEDDRDRRTQAPDSPRSILRQRRAQEERQRQFDSVPYGPEDLQSIVANARNSPRFRGSITALEIYAATGQLSRLVGGWKRILQPWQSSPSLTPSTPQEHNQDNSRR